MFNNIKTAYNIFKVGKHYSYCDEYLSRLILHKIDKSFSVSHPNATKFVQNSFPKETCFSLSGIKIPTLDNYHAIPQEAYDLIVQNPNFETNFNDKIDGLVNLVHHGEFMVEAAYWNEGSYEDENFGICKDDCVIDAGANIGVFSVLAIKEGANKVYAYEPNPSVMGKLKETIQLNGMTDKIITNQFALGNQIGTVAFEPEGLATGMIVDKGSMSVDMVTLDHWHGCENPVNFIKADIEGAERDFLMGAKDIIKRWHPRMSICTYHHPDDKKVLTKIIKNIDNSYRIRYHGKKLFAY